MSQSPSSENSTSRAGSNPAIEFVRRATRGLHDHLESRLAIAGPAPSDWDVTAYLAALYGWLLPLEERLWSFAWPAAMGADARSHKLEWLAHDLRGAGVELQRLPISDDPLPLEPLGSRCGLAYVIEGSTLGGRVLAARLAARGSRYAKSHFLAGYGAATGPMWQTFCAQFERNVSDPDDLAEAVRAAVHAFANLQQWFAEAGVLAA